MYPGDATRRIAHTFSPPVKRDKIQQQYTQQNRRYPEKNVTKSGIS